MSSSPKNRWQLSVEEAHSLRQFVTAMVLNGQVTAEAAGLHPVDLYVLNLLDIDGSATAGELAKRTALTTGAITKLVDRLTRAGFVERTSDPEDRRRVVLRIVGDSTAGALGGGSAPLFDPLARRMDVLISSFSDEQRRVLAEFFRLATEGLQHATEEVQENRRESRSGKRRQANVTN